MSQTTSVVTKLMNGKLRLLRHNKNPMIYARAWLKGKGEKGKEVSHRTGETELRPAKEVATHWYLEQLERIKKGEHLHGRLFSDVADAFIKHSQSHRKGEISDGQLEQYSIKWGKVKPHFKDVKVSDVDSAFLVKLRDELSKKITQYGRPIKPTTLRKDMQIVGQILTYAKDWEKCITSIPSFPSFRGKYKDVPEPIPFFTHDEWTKLRNAAKARIDASPDVRTKERRFELYCFLMLSVGAALRVDEAYSLRWMDCRKVKFGENTDAIHMRVLGKHKGKISKEREDAWAVYGGVSAYELLKKARPDAKDTDTLFTEDHAEGMRELLESTALYEVLKDGQTLTRNARSLRQTGISLRLELGDSIDIRDLARWARTTPEMIVRWYDQNNPQKSVERIVGFRKIPKKTTPKKKKKN